MTGRMSESASLGGRNTGLIYRMGMLVVTCLQKLELDAFSREREHDHAHGPLT